MKKALAIAALLLSSSAAMAYPNSIHMTCAQAKHYIDSRGSAILATCGEYAGFTSEGCGNNMMALAAYVRTKDAEYCYVGSYCEAYRRGGGGSYLQDGGDTCN